MGPSRAMGHVLPRQVLHGSMGSWHTVAEREGKQGSPSYSKLNLESVQGMDHWQTYLTVAPQQGACNSNACKSAFSIKKGSNFGPVSGARNGSQKCVQNLNHLALVQYTFLMFLLEMGNFQAPFLGHFWNPEMGPEK